MLGKNWLIFFQIFATLLHANCSSEPLIDVLNNFDASRFNLSELCNGDLKILKDGIEKSEVWAIKGEDENFITKVSREFQTKKVLHFQFVILVERRVPALHREIISILAMKRNAHISMIRQIFISNSAALGKCRQMQQLLAQSFP